MKRIIHHLALPALVPIVFFIVTALPVETLGCRNQALLAVSLALIGALAGLGATLVGCARKQRGEPDAEWWLLSMLLLVIPAIALLIIA